ncbi:MAG: hypothetical protein KBD31_01095 [Proteobacteria bacterium]|nr:hypothetical protein [Pseudomonadota bacterium]
MKKITFLIAAVSCLYAENNKNLKPQGWTFERQLHKMLTTDLRRFTDQELASFKEKVESATLKDSQKKFWISAIERFEKKNVKPFDLFYLNPMSPGSMKDVIDLAKSSEDNKKQLTAKIANIFKNTQTWAYWLSSEGLLDEKTYFELTQPEKIADSKKRETEAFSKAQSINNKPILQNNEDVSAPLPPPPLPTLPKFDDLAKPEEVKDGSEAIASAPAPLPPPPLPTLPKLDDLAKSEEVKDGSEAIASVSAPLPPPPLPTLPKLDDLAKSDDVKDNNEATASVSEPLPPPPLPTLPKLLQGKKIETDEELNKRLSDELPFSPSAMGGNILEGESLPHQEDTSDF